MDAGAIPPLAQHTIEVKTAYLALNSLDSDNKANIWQRMAVGAASGNIIRIGQGVHSFATRDAVYFPILNGKLFTTRLRQHHTLVRKLQSG